MKMYYVEIDGDLIGFYERNGFKVFHINVIDFQNPVLSIYEESQVKQAFESLPKPILIHCGAGEDRTGAAVEIYNCTSSNLIWQIYIKAQSNLTIWCSEVIVGY